MNEYLTSAHAAYDCCSDPFCFLNKNENYNNVVIVYFNRYNV